MKCAVWIRCLMLFCATWITDMVQAQTYPFYFKNQEGKKGALLSLCPSGGFTPDPDSIQLFVSEFRKLLGDRTPRVQGIWKKEDTCFQFIPAGQLVADQPYEVWYRSRVVHRFTLTPAYSGYFKIDRIYPDNDTLPSNILRWYLYFSSPSAIGQAQKYMRIISALGDTLEEPFVPLQPELWDGDKKRLTLWVDPGRVKSGLLSQQVKGVVFEEDKSYKLIFLRGWKSVEGDILRPREPYFFLMGAPQVKKLTLESWRLTLPGTSTSTPLRIDFPVVMDRILVEKFLRIQHEDGRISDGTLYISDNGRVALWSPADKWRKGTYRIVVDAMMEDVCGNNFNRPFDLDLKMDAPAGNQESYQRTFVIE